MKYIFKLHFISIFNNKKKKYIYIYIYNKSINKLYYCIYKFSNLKIILNLLLNVFDKKLI